MKSLILVRHAKSSWSNADLRDFDRPLNDRGRRDAPVMGQRLAARGLAIDAVVASPAIRALTTARTLLDALGMPPGRLRLDPAIYAADTDDLLEVVQGLPDDEDRIALVGHNPGFTDLAERLAAADIGNMPTCAMAFIAFDISAWSEAGFGTGALVDYDYPKKK